MKTITVLFMLFFTFQSYAIESGYYECLSRQDEMSEPFQFSLQLIDNRLSVYSDEFPEVEFTTSSEDSDFVTVPLEEESDNLGMYFFKYKFYSNDADKSLIFVSISKFIDSEETIEKTWILTEIDQNNLKISEFHLYSDGQKESFINLCTLEN